MKQIFLIAGIISFTTASAQQNDFFDIQKYLEKNNKHKFNIPVQKLPQTPIVLSKPSIPKLSFGDTATFSHKLPDGGKVYLLPQDNMPCIVPDMRQFNMPVAGYPFFYYLEKRKNLPGQIPNLMTPRKIIPEDIK